MDVNMNLMDKEAAVAAAAVSQIPSLEQTDVSSCSEDGADTEESPQYTQLLLKFNIPG